MTAVPGRSARQAPIRAWRGTPPREVAAPARRAVALVFRALARARSGRAFHPRGVVYAGWVHPVDDAAPAGDDALPFLRSGSQPVLVRVSKSVGLPARLPDVYGLSFRVRDVYGPGLHQDMLLATAGDRPLTRHVLRPALGADRLRYTSLLPYRQGDRVVLLGARYARTAPATPLHLADLDAEALAGRAAFELSVATLTGPWRPVGVIVLDRRSRLPEEEAERLRFHPWRTAVDLHPAGPLSRLRAPAYDGSQRGATSP